MASSRGGRPHGAAEMLGSRGYVFRPERFKDFQAPTVLLVGGDSPPFLRRPVHDALSSSLPNAKIVEMLGQQHVAMDTAPELFTREVLNFLAG